LCAQGDEAIVSAFSPKREHSHHASPLVRAYLDDDFFRSK